MCVHIAQNPIENPIRHIAIGETRTVLFLIGHGAKKETNVCRVALETRVRAILTAVRIVSCEQFTFNNAMHDCKCRKSLHLCLDILVSWLVSYADAMLISLPRF